jgi:hypothetical protein
MTAAVSACVGSENDVRAPLFPKLLNGQHFALITPRVKRGVQTQNVNKRTLTRRPRVNF